MPTNTWDGHSSRSIRVHTHDRLCDLTIERSVQDSVVLFSVHSGTSLLCMQLHVAAASGYECACRRHLDSRFGILLAVAR